MHRKIVEVKFDPTREGGGLIIDSVFIAWSDPRVVERVAGTLTLLRATHVHKEGDDQGAKEECTREDFVAYVRRQAAGFP